MSPGQYEAPLRPQECSITTCPPLNPFLNGKLNSFLRMKRFFSLLLNIGPPGGRWQVLEPFSTKMSRTSSPGPSGWWLPVVRLSLMHRLLSKHFNPVVSYSMATSERTHCAVAHSYGVLSPPAHSILAPPRHRGLGRGRGPVTDLDVWSQNPAGNSWWGQCFTSPSGPLWWTIFHLEKEVQVKNIVMFTYIMLIHCFHSLIICKWNLSVWSKPLEADWIWFDHYY